jgi:hypothetical protein
VQIEPEMIAKVALRRMTRDEVALVELRIERMLETRLRPTAVALRRLTGRFPASAPVFYEYAAAEYARVQHSDFGGRPVFRGFGFSNGELIVMANPYSDAEAWRAVNRALAIDPAHRQAQRLKAEIMLSRLVRAGELAGADEYDAVRALLAHREEIDEQRDQDERGKKRPHQRCADGHHVKPRLECCPARQRRERGEMRFPSGLAYPRLRVAERGPLRRNDRPSAMRSAFRIDDAAVERCAPATPPLRRRD